MHSRPLSNLPRKEYSEALWNTVPRCYEVYGKFADEGIFIEVLPESIRYSVRKKRRICKRCRVQPVLADELVLQKYRNMSSHGHCLPHADIAQIPSTPSPAATCAPIIFAPDFGDIFRWHTLLFTWLHPNQPSTKVPALPPELCPTLISTRKINLPSISRCPWWPQQTTNPNFSSIKSAVRLRSRRSNP